MCISFKRKYVKRSFNCIKVWQVGWHHHWLSATNCLTTQKFSLTFLLPPTPFLSVSVELSSLHTVSVQSAYNNIVPLPPTQTHPLCAPRSPRLPCVATAPAVTRALAWRPGNRAVMPVAAVSNGNAHWLVKMISESWGSKKTEEKKYTKSMKTNSTGLNRGKTHKLQFVGSEVSSVLYSETLG